MPSLDPRRRSGSRHPASGRRGCRSSAGRGTRAMGSYRALLIGNSSFPADAHNLRPLAGPVNDVAVLRAALADPTVGLFEPEAVRLVVERNSQEIREELDRFF